MAPSSSACLIKKLTPLKGIANLKSQFAAIFSSRDWARKGSFLPNDDAAGDEKSGRTTRIDKHVGSRIRLRRKLLGLSQEELAAALGITSQQLQKYERGVNRVTASRLAELTRALDVPIGFFFDDLPGSSSTVTGGFRPSAPVPITLGNGFPPELLGRRETLELVRAYDRIADPAVRKRVLDLIKSLEAANAS